jgi:hypothetical protein
MKFEKSIATFLAGLMSLVSIAYPVIAATQLGSYPTFLVNTDGSLNAYLVVGASAQSADVIGAADIAARLAQASAISVPVQGGTLGTGINGIEKNTLNINYGNLTDSTGFPNPIRSFVYSGLQTGTFSYKGSTYNFHEDINMGNLYFSHDYATNYINGTETLVAQSGQLMYEYVFDSTFYCNITGSGYCTYGTPEYGNPVGITMLGKTFKIVGIDSNAVTMLAGNVGSTTATQCVAAPTGNYSVCTDYGNAPSSGTAWVRVLVKDSSGNTVESKSINQGDSYDFTAEGISVRVTTVRVLPDGSSAGSEVVVGPIGTTLVQYPATCNVGGTGSSNYNFPGEVNWCIQGSFATAGKVTAGDKIQVVYKPSSTQYIKYPGSGVVKLPFPNGNGEIGFEGWNYNSFATLTFKYLAPQSVFFAIGGGSTNSTSVPGTTVSGIEVDSDTPGTLVDPNTNTGYSRVYYLFNTSLKTPAYNSSSIWPVMVGFYDSVNSRIGVNLTSPYYKALSWDNTTLSNDYLVFNTTVSYGGGASTANQFVLFVNMTGPPYATMQTVGGTGTVSYFSNFALVPYVSTSDYYADSCVSGSGCGLLMNWVNTSTPASTWTTSSNPTFRLYTSDSADAKDIQSSQTPSGGGTIAYQDIGQSVQDVVSNGGVIVATPASQGSNTVVVKVPAQLLQVKAYVGTTGTSTTTTGGTYQQSVPILQSISKLDSEVTAADETSHDLILVGGPCVNTLVASLATASGNATAQFPYSCNSWPARNFGRIQVIDSPVYGTTTGTGHQAIVVAGTRADDTRLAADVLMQYDTLLHGQTASAVEVTSLSASGITAVS